MATQMISVRVEDNVKEQAERVLRDMGMNISSYIVSSINALVTEGRIPFDHTEGQRLTEQMILEKLDEAEREEADPNVQWLSHEEVFGKIRERYGYERRVLTQSEIRDRLMPVITQCGVKRVILFGSYAKGTATDESDVDLVVDSGRKGFDFLTMCHFMEKALDKRTEIFDITHIEKGSQVSAEIDSTGVVLFE